MWYNIYIRQKLRQKGGEDIAVYLSQANIPIKTGQFNLVNAPMGSGKTRFTASTPVPEGKINLLITVLRSTQRQVSQDGTYIATPSAALRHITQHWAFGEPHEYANHERFALTIQSLIKVYNQNIISWGRIHTVFIDEIDWIVQDLLKWGKAADEAEYKQFMAFLGELSKNTTVVGLSATGIPTTQILLSQWLAAAGVEVDVVVCEPDKPLHTLPHHHHKIPSAKAMILANPSIPSAAYFTTVRECVQFKEWCEERGLRAVAVVSDKAKNYTMTEDEIAVKRSIEENESIPEWVDVVAYNDTIQRGVNIHNGHIRQVFVGGADERANTQAHGRFRYEVDVYWESRWADSYLDVVGDGLQIPVPDKKHWHRAMGFRTWKDWKEELERLGYTATTRKGVVYVGKAEEKESAARKGEEKNNHPLPGPSTCSSPLYLHLGKGKFVEEEGVEGIQENVWYTASVLKQVFGFTTASGAKEYAENRLGCGVVEARKRINNKLVRLFAFAASSDLVGEAYNSQVVYINGEEHLRQVEDIHEFENRSFNEERFLQYLINIATIE